MIIVYVYYYMVLFCTIPFSTVIMWGNKYGGDGRKEQLVCVHLNWTQKGRQFFKESVVHLKRRKVEGDTKLLKGKPQHPQRSKRKERLRYCRKIVWIKYHAQAKVFRCYGKDKESSKLGIRHRTITWGGTRFPFLTSPQSEEKNYECYSPSLFISFWT